MSDSQLESLVLLSFKGVEPPPSRDLIRKRAFELASVIGVDSKYTEEIVKRVEANLVTTMDEGVSLVDVNDPHDEEWVRQKEDVKWSYWTDYERHLAGEGWGPKVVHVMGEVTDRILGLLKDPDTPGEWDRRGLVIGHVQSGKTANYIGLIAKAADAGYRFIIVIAGIHNNLRKQTQSRLDEGFIGRNGETKQLVGVGGLNKKRAFPIPLTNTASDFSKKFASANTADLEAYDRPVILVIKKNVTTLGNVYSWLKELNADQAGQISKIPMLLIDDEADNASINTNKPDLDPTRTNAEIRRLLKLFKKSCYVGYTATPFANIFINPDTPEDMLEDLFPKDFIYCLDAPSNYFGAQKVFIDDDTSEKIVRVIDDAEDYFPLSHKKHYEIQDLPPSAIRAIYTFIVARAIRCIRNQSNKHCSMMFNVSRFVDTQRQIKEHVSLLLNGVRDAIRYNYKKPTGEALQNSVMKELKVVFDAEFSSCSEVWEEVQSRLLEASDDMKTYLVNSKSDESLDYEKYEKSGDSLTALAVGGLSLSRGLTLEGLIVSYMYRNTKMYDTLMQMGRWFGYRQGYDDLCRVYLSDDSKGWYAHIAEATEDLRQQIKQMRRDGFSPKDFGLYVRAHPDALIITALNKMRHAQRMTFKVSFDGVQRETHVLPSLEEIRKKNLQRMTSLYETLRSECGLPIETNANIAWRKVPLDIVIEFIADFRFHRELQGTKDALLSYAREVSDSYPLWDVGFISLTGSSPSQEYLPMTDQKRQVGKLLEKVKIPSEEDGWYVGNKQKVAGTGVESVGLIDSELEKAVKIAEENGRSKPQDRDYRHKDVRGRPLLMLHLLELFDKAGDEPTVLARNVPALGFSFPATGDFRSVDCVVNKVWLQNDMIDSPDEEDDYDA